MALAARWAWQSSPRLTVLAVLVQLAAGAVTAFGLLATADVFTQLLAQGPTPERVLAALPAVAHGGGRGRDPRSAGRRRRRGAGGAEPAGRAAGPGHAARRR